jgi:hypothetical protein
MAQVFTRFFDVAFKNGSSTKAMVVSNGSIQAKPKAVVEHKGNIWRYRKQMTDKSTGELLPEFMYFQDDSVQKADDPSTFFQEAA